VSRRWAATAAAVAVATGGLVLAVPAPVQAAACSGTSGVTVVVDFGSLGGIQVGCAAGNPSSGLAALHAAGFTTTGTQKDGIRFVCRINGAPASDPCVLTPPASAYWSYWHVSEGAWVYSSDGATTYDPDPGEVEGWAFGSGGRPGIAAPAAPAPPTTNPPPRTTASRQPAPLPPPPGAPRPSTAGAPPPAAHGGSSGAGPGPTASGPARSGPGGATSARSSTGGPPTTEAGVSTTAPTAAAAPTTSDPRPPASAATEPTSSSQKAVGATALGVALVLGIGLAAFLVAQRRRRTG
jgi:hypothetical protein